MSESKQKNASVKKPFAVAALDYVEMFVLATAVVILLLTFCARLCVVSGDSMKNTLFNGQTLVVSNLFYTPKSGDIIVLHQTGAIYNEPIVKRVIATGGQHVRIDYMNNKVYVSDVDVFTEDEIIDESSYAYFDKGGLWKEAASLTPPENFAVPDGHLFVLGDNRNVSADSRTDDIGMVDERRVLGKVLFRLAPFQSFS